MTRIAIAGASGRMGRNLIVAVHETDGMVLSQALCRQSSSVAGSDSGILAGIGENNILLTDQIDASQFDVLIDFTLPEATRENLKYCLEHKKALVIGTTGCDSQLQQAMQMAGEHIALV
ncbi:MAG: 4-hydroxy-tetrahydrodipicolinate reductase, partial [Pseudomonadota bacterium]